MSEQVTTIYLVRHGETAWNAEERCQGTADIPLNAAGLAQVARLGERLRGVAFDVAYASWLSRSLATARAIVDDTVVPIRERRHLEELSYGDWQGTPPSTWPDHASDVWFQTPWAITFPGGESLAMVRARVVPLFHQIVSEHAGQTILLSSHGHVNRLLLIDALGLDDDRFWSIAQPNADGHRMTIQHDPSGAWMKVDALPIPPLAADRSASSLPAES